MNIKNQLLGLFVALSLTATAQNVQKEVLFSIDGNPYYTDEFSRVYKKNIDLVKDESQKDLDKYLELFIGYKLKINKANKLGLQNNAKYKAELESYRNQLAKNYLTDSKVTKELLDEAYARSLKEVKASHILLMLDENAAPADTLKVYNQALDIRKRALNGEDFGVLAQQLSHDQSAKENQGELGYFSAFRMVYPFETGAYKTAVGEISKPVRTRFGYHLIKVHDVRANRGQVSVAHIMITKPSGNDPKAADQAKSTITDIYKKLKQGESFDALAKQFSDDKSTSEKGGSLGKFTSGDMSSEEFENVSFSLTEPNQISEPFESSFGWHIVKLIEKYPVKTFEQAEQELESKIKRDDRSRLIEQSLNDKLRKKYTVKRDDKQFALLRKMITDSIYSSKWKVPAENKSADKTLLVIDGKKAVSGTEFFNYVYKRQRTPMTVKPLSALIDRIYSDFIDEQLNLYYNANLENEFPAFAEVMEEYRDGLLLFELMEKEIWEKAKTDTVGLENFYKQNISRYQWRDRVDAIVASSAKEEVARKALKMLQQKKTVDEIKAKLNVGGAVDIMINEGQYEEGSSMLPAGLKINKGLSDVLKKDNYFYVVKINDIFPAGPKQLSECRGKVVNDYQQSLEENWVSDLKKEFLISVDPQVFAKVKKEIRP